MIQSVIKSEIGSFLEQEFTSEWVPPFNQPVTSFLDSESGCQLSTFLVAFGFLSIRSEESHLSLTLRAKRGHRCPRAFQQPTKANAFPWSSDSVQLCAWEVAKSGQVSANIL